MHWYGQSLSLIHIYDERLDIRPKYQREFVYKDAQRDEVIRTVMKGLPLNVMYGCKVKKEDGSDGFEVLDGQQRTISLCEYVDGSFSVDDKYFYNLPADKKQQILDYPLFVYVCDGTDSEKLEWFRIINIAGEELTDQELRNAVYAGSWTSDAKRYFSKTCLLYTSHNVWSNHHSEGNRALSGDLHSNSGACITFSAPCTTDATVE